MSAECSKCGNDIVYPVGTWPIGECPVCSRGRPDGRARDYLISFSARRTTRLPRWVPFNSPRTDLVKHTTWDDAHYRADLIANEGGWNVTVTFAEESE